MLFYYKMTFHMANTHNQSINKLRDRSTIVLELGHIQPFCCFSVSKYEKCIFTVNIWFNKNIFKLLSTWCIKIYVYTLCKRDNNVSIWVSLLRNTETQKHKNSFKLQKLRHNQNSTKGIMCVYSVMDTKNLDPGLIDYIVQTKIFNFYLGLFFWNTFETRDLFKEECISRNFFDITFPLLCTRRWKEIKNKKNLILFWTWNCVEILVVEGKGKKGKSQVKIRNENYMVLERSGVKKNSHLYDACIPFTDEYKFVEQMVTESYFFASFSSLERSEKKKAHYLVFTWSILQIIHGIIR